MLFEPILFVLLQKEKNGFNLPRKERARRANRCPEFDSKDLSYQLFVVPVPTSRKVSALCASPFGGAASQNPSAAVCPPSSRSRAARQNSLKPNCDPVKRSQVGKEEGDCGYGVFAAPAETEWSWLLLTPRRFFSFSKRERKEWGRKIFLKLPERSASVGDFTYPAGRRCPAAPDLRGTRAMRRRRWRCA